jgi:hypothetical protein
MEGVENLLVMYEAKPAAAIRPRRRRHERSEVHLIAAND